MNIEVSIGEVIDKLTILEIKKERITTPSKLKNIEKEYNYLLTKLKEEINLNPKRNKDYKRLKEINEVLWDVEDKIREQEKNNLFDDIFIDLARTVYITNDKRSELKKELNLKFNSNFVEEKSYTNY